MPFFDKLGETIRKATLTGTSFSNMIAGYPEYTRGEPSNKGKIMTVVRFAGWILLCDIFLTNGTGFADGTDCHTAFMTGLARKLCD